MKAMDQWLKYHIYEWAVLMTNLELERWTLEYTIQASDEEYTVETEGEFVFQNNVH